MDLPDRRSGVAFSKDASGAKGPTSSALHHTPTQRTHARRTGNTHSTLKGRTGLTGAHPSRDDTSAVRRVQPRTGHPRQAWSASSRTLTPTQQASQERRFPSHL